jgi:putative lipase involved disintegration of autophagic bodies
VYPGSVEFDKNVLGVIEDNVFVVVCNDNGDGAFLCFGDGFALDTRCHTTVEVTIYKFLDILGGDLLGLIKGEFLVICNVLNGKRGPCLFPIESKI